MQLIYVPQKCYAVITPDTDKSIVGLYTDGLSTCAGIIVKISSPSYTLLYHADARTDLSDEFEGLLGLI